MERILPAYGLPKETVTAIMMLYGNTYFFDIVAGVLQGDTFVPYLFIISVDYILQTLIDVIKENGCTLKKTRNRQYLSETIVNADYTYPSQISVA